MIIKKQVDMEVQLRGLLDAMSHYILAIKQQSYLPADERLKALEQVEAAIPTARRCLIYLKTKEIYKK